jgi:hypothetical protein
MSVIYYGCWPSPAQSYLPRSKQVIHAIYIYNVTCRHSTQSVVKNPDPCGHLLFTVLCITLAHRRVSFTKASVKMGSFYLDAVCRVHCLGGSLWQSSSYVQPGDVHGCSSVDGHKTCFVTNPSLDNQAIAVPLGYNVEWGVGGMETPMFPVFCWLPLISSD